METGDHVSLPPATLHRLAAAGYPTVPQPDGTHALVLPPAVIAQELARAASEAARIRRAAAKAAQKQDRQAQRATHDAAPRGRRRPR